MRCKIFILMVVGIFLISPVFAISDISVFQGQYHNETSFIQGTFEFTFNVYDAGVGGNLVGFHKTNLTTGSWGQWKAEIPGVSAACNDTTKDYFMEILIDGVPQIPRRRLSHFNYLRKDVDEVTSGAISSSGMIGAKEYTFSPQEGQSIMDSYFNFVGPSKGDLIRISPREDFLGFPNATSIFIISDNESYVGMTHFISPTNSLSNSWLWTDVHKGSGGFAIIDTEDISVGKEYIVKGAFANDRLSLGGVSNNPQGESSAGMDFIIYKDANGTKSFFVDSANSYATTINALLNVTDTAYFDDAYINDTKVCLADGTNCQVQNISFSENDTLQTITDRGTVTNNSITIGSVINFILGGYIQEFVDKFLISKDLEVDGNLNVTGEIRSSDKLVCLEDGTNCQIIIDTNRSDVDILSVASVYNDTSWVLSQNYLISYSETDPTLWTALFNSTGDARWGGSTDTNCSVDGSCSLITYDSELNYTIDTDTSASTECTSDEVLLGNGSCVSSASFGGGSSGQYVSFISTVDGDLKTGPKYLPLGTDAPISGSDDEASWIIDRDLTITGFLWNAKSNNMNKVAEIILIKSTSNKDSFSETSLSEDIQGATTGSVTGSVSFSQGDLAAIKYSSAGSGPKKIKDLSITLIGTYD